VIEHVRFKYACRECEEHVALASAPAQPIAKGFAGPGLLSTILVGKYSDHLPLYRHESIFSRNGVQLSRSTMSRWVLETAELLQPLTDLMKSRVLQSSVVHTDDTTVPVQDQRLSRTRTGRFWVYCGDAAHPYSVYDFTPNRERAGLRVAVTGQHRKAKHKGRRPGVKNGENPPTRQVPSLNQVCEQEVLPPAHGFEQLPAGEQRILRTLGVIEYVQDIQSERRIPRTRKSKNKTSQ